MNEKERAVVEKLAEAWNLFVALPSLHQWEKQEFMHAIHSAQTMVMARPEQALINKENAFLGTPR